MHTMMPYVLPEDAFIAPEIPWKNWDIPVAMVLMQKMEHREICALTYV